MIRRSLPASIAALALIAATPAVAKPISDTGPNTVTKPYVIPVAAGVHIKSLLTVDDAGAAADGYELTGIPDGLGAMADGRHGFKLFMNHEFTAAQGGVHRHGQKGAYVSTFRIDSKTFEVEEGMDTIDPGVRFWDYVASRYGAVGSPGGVNPRTSSTTRRPARS